MQVSVRSSSDMIASGDVLTTIILGRAGPRRKGRFLIPFCACKERSSIPLLTNDAMCSKVYKEIQKAMDIERHERE